MAPCRETEGRGGGRPPGCNAQEGSAAPQAPAGWLPSPRSHPHAGLPHRVAVTLRYGIIGEDTGMMPSVSEG